MSRSLGCLRHHVGGRWLEHISDLRFPGPGQKRECMAGHLEGDVRATVLCVFKGQLRLFLCPVSCCTRLPLSAGMNPIGEIPASMAWATLKPSLHVFHSRSEHLVGHLSQTVNQLKSTPSQNAWDILHWNQQRHFRAGPTSTYIPKPYFQVAKPFYLHQ